MWYVAYIRACTAKKPDGIPDVRPEIGGHRLDRREQAREGGRVGAHERVLRVGDVEAHGPLVGVDDDLDRVPDVVAEPGDALGVREPVGGRVAVHDPGEVPVGADDQVRVGVESKERRDPAHALADLAVEQDPALRRDLGAQEDAVGAEADGEEEPPPDGSDLDAALPLVGRVDVLVARRVVDLLGPRPHEHVVVGHLAEVDLRPRDAERRLGGHRRDVLHVELGQPLPRDAVDGPDHRPVPVGVLEVLVDPLEIGVAPLDVAREVLVRELARGEHDLLVLPVDDVPVVVHVDEPVVRPDLLQLREGQEERGVVPQADVLQRRRVVGQVGAVSVSRAGKSRSSIRSSAKARRVIWMWLAM